MLWNINIFHRAGAKGRVLGAGDRRSIDEDLTAQVGSCRIGSHA